MAGNGPVPEGRARFIFSSMPAADVETLSLSKAPCTQKMQEHTRTVVRRIKGP